MQCRVYGSGMPRKKSKIVAFGLFVLIAGLLAHAADGVAVSGTVSDGQGEAIAGATVELSVEGGAAQREVARVQFADARDLISGIC